MSREGAWLGQDSWRGHVKSSLKIQTGVCRANRGASSSWTLALTQRPKGTEDAGTPLASQVQAGK